MFGLNQRVAGKTGKPCAVLEAQIGDRLAGWQGERTAGQGISDPAGDRKCPEGIVIDHRAHRQVQAVGSAIAPNVAGDIRAAEIQGVVATPKPDASNG